MEMVEVGALGPSWLRYRHGLRSTANVVILILIVIEVRYEQHRNLRTSKVEIVVEARATTT